MSAAIHEISGTYTHDPQRRPQTPGESLPKSRIGPPPKHWKKESSIKPGTLEALWREFVREFGSALGISDRKDLEALCVATYESRRVSKQQIGWSRVAASLRKTLLTRLGDRARLVAPPVEQKKAGGLRAFVDRKKAG